MYARMYVCMQVEASASSLNSNIYIHVRMYSRMYVCMQVEASASSLNSNSCFILYAPTGAVFLWLGHWADMQQRNIASYAGQRHQQVEEHLIQRFS